MWLTSDKPLRCKGLQMIAKYGNMISRGVGNNWQSFQIGGYECIKREYVTPIKRGAIAVFVDVGSSSSRWFRRREGRSRVFCFPTKEMNREERLSKSLFTRFLHIAWRIAGDIAHRVAERLGTAMPPPFDGLHAIGVDETSHRKGHTYLTVVVDHERHRVIWAHGGYGGDVFDLFFKALTPGQRESIRVVTGDGTHWIDPCTGRWCPAAERVLDGFHIVSWMTDALDGIRNTDPRAGSTVHGNSRNY